MLKFIHVVWISNFYIFLADFKHVVLSRLNELLGLWYIAGKSQISSFYIMFPNFIWPENLPQYMFIYLISLCKILALSNIRFERYVQSRKTSQQIF